MCVTFNKLIYEHVLFIEIFIEVTPPTYNRKEGNIYGYMASDIW